jgi:hypothetical protein
MFGRFRTTNVEVLLRFESQTFDLDGFASFFLTTDRICWWRLWVLPVNHNTEHKEIGGFELNLPDVEKVLLSSQPI